MTSPFGPTGEDHDASVRPTLRDRIAGWIDAVEDTSTPLPRYVARTVALTFLPSLLISIVIHLLFPTGGPTLRGSTANLVLGVVVVAPVIETLLMIPIFWVLRHGWREPRRLAIASAVVWAALHSLSAPTWGLGVAWTFFVLSVAFLAHERERSRGRAIVVVTLLHATHNAITILLALASR